MNLNYGCGNRGCLLCITSISKEYFSRIINWTNLAVPKILFSKYWLFSCCQSAMASKLARDSTIALVLGGLHVDVSNQETMSHVPLENICSWATPTCEEILKDALASETFCPSLASHRSKLRLMQELERVFLESWGPTRLSHRFSLFSIHAP